MDFLKNIALGLFHGFWDSLSGVALLLSIDNERNRKKAEKIARQRERDLQRERSKRRSPSPCPSSASAMNREEKLEPIDHKKTESAFERTIESIRGDPKSNKVDDPNINEKKIFKKVLKCCLLNGGFTWLSIVLFEEILLPSLKFVLTVCYGQESEMFPIIWAWLKPILTILFGMMWVLPIFLLSKIVSSLWFSDIANAAFKVRKGPPQLIPSKSKIVADFIFSLLVQAMFLMQSMLVNLLPIKYAGSTLCFFHLCYLYSLYSFEYKWFNMGWELHRRLSYIEYNWPYFIGFGIPLTVITNMANSIIVSSCIFSIFFPLFILSANEAKPVIGTTETPLRLFAPVVFVSNLLFIRESKKKKQQTVKMTELQWRREQDRSEQLRRERQLQSLDPLQKAMYRQPANDNKQQPFHGERHPQNDNKRQESQTHRYAQPPPLRTSPPRTTTPDRNIVPYFGSGILPLIPTPVPGAPTAAHH